MRGRGEDGQALVLYAFLLLFVLVGLLAAVGVSIGFWARANVQKSADAAALAGAEAIHTKTVTLDGKTLCTLRTPDTAEAQKAALHYWQGNLTPSAQTLSVSGSAKDGIYTFAAKVKEKIGVLGVVGHPTIEWTVTSRATIQKSSCKNPFNGPVFSIPYPGGEKHTVWNTPTAAKNAPGGWPVYFVKTFSLAQKSPVTVTFGADDQATLMIDGTEEKTATIWQQATITTTLGKGPHVIVVKAKNISNGHQWGPNPAVLTLTASAYGRTLFTTQGNPMTNGGEPVTQSDWSSYTPPNPRWAVYADPMYPTSWMSSFGSTAAYFQKVGFELKTASQFEPWMNSEMNGGQAGGSLAVMAQDIAPDTVMATDSKSALIRRYLNAGGNILWAGDIPLYYQGLYGGGSNVWGTGGEENVLGLNAGGNWNDYASSQRTPAGADYGLPSSPGPSVRAIIPSGCPSPQALATVPGAASAWRLDFGYGGGCRGPYGREIQKASYSMRSPGFVRVHDEGFNGGSLMSDARLWGIAGATLEWWVGETPFSWVQPFSGPVFHDAYPGHPDAVWNTPHASQNAPGGWPVSFSRTFTLTQRTTLNITSFADDKILSLQVDGKTLPAGGLGGPVTASVTLPAGKHLLYVKAENVASQHQWGPNPAGLAVEVKDSSSTLFTTASGGWKSYSPPNPDWAVFSDPGYPTSFVTHSGVQALASYLGPVGFETKNASQLAAWMNSEIAGGNAGNSVLVMANDIAPDTVLGTENGRALFAHYLKAGGNILWLGEVPLYFQGHNGGSVTTWGIGGLTKVLGLQNGSRFWSGGQGTLVTNAGRGYGIGQSPWQSELSQRAMPRSDKVNCQLEPLAWLNGPPSGGQHGVSYWRHPFWPTPPASCSFGTNYLQDIWAKDAPGLLRIYDFRGLPLGSSVVQQSILGVAAQMAGWYPGQDTHFGGPTPPPARNLNLSFPQGTSTAAGTPFPINFKVTDQNGALMPDQAVTFKVSGTDSGSFWAASAGALNPQDPNSLTLKTNGQGVGTAWAAFEPQTGSIKVQASIPGWSSSQTQAVQVTANTGASVKWKPGDPNPVPVDQNVTFSGKVVDSYGFGATPGQGYVFSWPGTWQRPYVQTGAYGTFSVTVQATYVGSSWTSLSGLSGKGPNPGPETVWPPAVSMLQPYLWLGNQASPGSEFWAPWTPPNKTYSDYTFQPGLAKDRGGQALWISHQRTPGWLGSADLRCASTSAGGTCPGSLSQPGNTGPVRLPPLSAGRYTFAMTPTGQDVMNPQTSYLHFSIPGLTGWRVRVDRNGITSYEWSPGGTLNLGNLKTGSLSFSLEGVDNLGRIDAGYTNGGRNTEGVWCSAGGGGVCPSIPWVPLGSSGTPYGFTGFSSPAHFTPGSYTLTFPAGEFGDQGGQNWTQGWVNTTVTFTVQRPKAPYVYWRGAPGTYTAGGSGTVSWSFTPPNYGGYRGWSQAWDTPDTAGPEFTTSGGQLSVKGLKPGTHHVVLTFFFANGYVAKVTSPAVTIKKGPHIIDQWLFNGGANGHELPNGWSVTPGSFIYSWNPFTWGAQNHWLSGPAFKMPNAPVTLKIVTNIPGGNWAGYSVWGMTDGTQGTRFNLGTDWAYGSGNSVYGWRLGPNSGRYYPGSVGPYLGPPGTMATYSIALTPGSSDVFYSVNGGPTYTVYPDAGAAPIRSGDWIGFQAFASYDYSGSGFPFAVKSVTVIEK